jgi:DNA-binding HxlR family transcriptional regulator
MTHGTTDPTVCQMAGFTDVIGGRWKLGILCTLTTDGKARFNELVERLHPVTPTTLTRQLRELERDGLVKRTQYNEIPPRVEYEATELSATLGPVLETIAEWVHTHAIQRSAANEPASTGISQPV